MNPINLLLPDGTPSKVWACGECKITRVDQEHAEKCCTMVPCKVCGQETDKKFRLVYLTETCDACRMAEAQRKDAERIAKATKLSYWDGWVWDESDYYNSLEDYVEHLECNHDPEDWPEWVYVTASRPGVSLDVSRILENYCDDGYEGMDDDLKGVDELTKAINRFNAANHEVVVYDGDWSRAVRVPKPTAALSPTEAAPDA